MSTRWSKKYRIQGDKNHQEVMNHITTLDSKIETFNQKFSQVIENRNNIAQLCQLTIYLPLAKQLSTNNSPIT